MFLIKRKKWTSLANFSDIFIAFTVLGLQYSTVITGNGKDGGGNKQLGGGGVKTSAGTCTMNN